MSNNFPPVVTFVSCDNYDKEKVYAAIERMMVDVPPPDVNGKTVLLKPNIVDARKPERAACTHPSIVYAAIKAFFKRGAVKVLVGDSPITVDGKLAAQVSGIYNAVIEAGGTWVDFKNAIEIACPEGKVTKSVVITDIFTQVDMVVTLPKLKTHKLMAYTGAMKNLFGLLVGETKQHIHYRYPVKKDFAAFLTDLNSAVKPKYGIMDGILAMSGEDGPTNGIPTQLGVLAASDNVLALDWMCASLVGYDPMRIENLADALERKIWFSSSSDIQLKGDDFVALKPKEFAIAKNVRQGTVFERKPDRLYIKIARKIVNVTEHAPFSYLRINHLIRKYPYFLEACIVCGTCVSICPAKALSVRNKKIKLDKSKCIRCCCCHEICPKNAIDIKRGL
jgi:uncharacterized protein (DUF362 family)/Pyruvate/2-oxoacid:ferredoxin oxidoreductase delta subunit